MNYKLHAGLLLCSSLLITSCSEQSSHENATDKAKEAVSTVADKAQTSASAVADKAKEAVSTIADKAQTSASAVADKAQEAISDTTKKASDAVNEVSSKVQNKVNAVSGEDVKALALEAQAVLQSFSKKLKGELIPAMQSGGPVKAIDICHTRANEIANEMSAKNNVRLKRVSLKNRNPKSGVPNTWEMDVLHDFEKQLAAGKSIADIKYAKIVTEGNNKEFRLMKAIPTKPLCLSCHGDKIQPDVQAKLKALYPDDKAVGFKEGEIRGAFVYSKMLK